MSKENDIQGLPNVDLTPIIDQLEGTTDNQDQSQVQGQPADKPVLRDQFKSEEDRIKGYKELQGFATKVSQENKTLKQQLAEIQEQMELAKYQPSVPTQNYNFNNQINPTEPQYMTREEFATSRIAEVLEEEHNKDGKPDPEFRERYAFAQMMAQEYPHLSTSPVGVRKLFELGDKRRAETLRKNAGKALESIFGTPLNEEQTERLRKMVLGDKAIQTQQQTNSNAYMPDTSTSTMSGQNQNQKPNAELKIKQSVEKGDVDGVIEGMFEDILKAE